MTFLQPFILWGLPLALLPILIHLLNRMRFRTRRWAAMSFLFSANRASTRYAKLRQLLILACRVLALLALILAIARPLAGGWLGWALSPSPDVVLVLLDRSASMEMHNASSTVSRREQALRSIATAAAPLAERTRFVLVENVLRKPQEIAKADYSTLSGMALTAPTDASADIPAMLDAAAEWLTRNQSGLAEIWIASDLQRSNWQPDSTRWAAVSARLASLKQTVRVRMLALGGEAGKDTSVAIAETNRRDRDGQPQLDVTFDLQRAENAPASLPVTLTLDDARSRSDIALQGQSTRVHHTFPLDHTHENGWGKIEIPADANPRDNAAYFVYGPKPLLHSALTSTNEQSRFFLRLASSPSKQGCDVFEHNAPNMDWRKYALVVWQDTLPDGKTAEALQAYVKDGGVLVFFPPGETSANSFAGMGWGAAETADRDQPWRVTHWDEQDGPLAKSDEGLSLPLDGLDVRRRQIITGGAESRATFADAKPFLSVRALGRGSVVFCSTLPDSEWSNLGDGRVLVPMLQRLLENGGRRFEGGSAMVAGDPALVESPAEWSSVDAPKKDVRFDAGIYHSGARLIAVNRPAAEDMPDVVEKSAVKPLFGSLPVQFFEEQGGATPLQGEIWRGILIAMLAALLVEGFLSLPVQAAHAQQPQTKKAAPARPEFAGSASS